jgi:hypothetical protein
MQLCQYAFHRLGIDRLATDEDGRFIGRLQEKTRPLGHQVMHPAMTVTGWNGLYLAAQKGL